MFRVAELGFDTGLNGFIGGDCLYFSRLSFALVLRASGNVQKLLHAPRPNPES